MPAATEVTVGTLLPTIVAKHEISVSVAYAGASGDLNPLHFDPAFAAMVSPTGDVIAHGMYSMGLASRLVTGWAGGPEQVGEVTVRFSKPWPIGTTSTFGGEVRSVEADTATVALWADNENGTRILSGTAEVRLK